MKTDKSSSPAKIWLFVGILAVLIAVFAFWRSGTDLSGSPASSIEQNDQGGKGRPSDAKVSRAEGSMNGVQASRDLPMGTLQLEGQVLDEQELPVADAEVLISSDHPRSTQSEANGTFMFSKLPSRKYRISARSGNRLAGPMDIILTESTPPLILRLKKAASLRVTIYDGDSDKVMQGALVVINKEKNDERCAETNKEGWVLFGGLANDTLRVEASAPGYGIASEYIEVATQDGDAGALTILLFPGSPVSGSVVDPEGTPLAGATVSANRAGSGGRLGTTKSNAEGQWSFSGLSAGRFEFKADHEDYLIGKLELVTLDGRKAVSNLVIQMRVGGEIKGEVRDSSGKRVPNAVLRAIPKDEPLRDACSKGAADAEGYFHMKGLARRELRLAAQDDSRASKDVDVDLKSKASADGVILVLKDGRIQGVVVTSEGEPISGAEVEARLLGGWGRHEGFFSDSTGNITDANGHFSVGPLMPGTYKLTAGYHLQSIRPAQPRVSASQEARPGEKDVHLVMDPHGGIKGRIRTKNGETPKGFQIWYAYHDPMGRGMMMILGDPLSFSNEDGSFLLQGIPTGRFELRVVSDSFKALIKKDIKVSDGKITDVGTLIAESGRSIRGTVVNRHHEPIEGAIVETGISFLKFKDNSRSSKKTSWAGERRRKKTGPDGRFLVEGFSEHSFGIIAHHRRHGHSSFIEIPKGEENQEIEILIKQTGTLTGRVSRGNQALDRARVELKEANHGKISLSKKTASDGTYKIEDIPQGDYFLRAIAATNPGRLPPGEIIMVEGGEEKNINIDLGAVGSIIKVSVDFRGPSKDPWALVKLNAPIEGARKYGEILAHYDRRLHEVEFKTIRPEGSEVTNFINVPSGDYTVCILPSACVFGNMVLKPHPEDLHELPVSCTVVRVAEGTKELTVNLATP